MNYKLFDACSKGNLDLLKDLVQNDKFDVSSEDHISIKMACAYGHINIIEYLVANGADLSTNHYRPLVIALENGHLNVIKYAINLKICSSSIMNELRDIASDKGKYKIADYLHYVLNPKPVYKRKYKYSEEDY